MELPIPGGRVVMVGFGKMLLGQMERFLPPGSVVVIEDPDIIRKRDVHADAVRLGCVGSVVTARYHQDLEFVDAVEEHLAGEAVALIVPGLEYGVLGAAILAERWNLPGAGTVAAHALTDKLELRAAARAGGLRNPESAEVHGPQDVREFARRGPLVLKPANRHASLGVQMLQASDDIDSAWAFTVAARDDMMLPDTELTWRYIAERRLSGHEYSAEALVRRGEIIFVNVTAKLTAKGRYPVELGHVVPAELPGPVRERFTEVMANMIAAIRFDTGILHAEWMLDDQGPVLIECAGRVPGDSIVFLIDAAYGSDLVRSMVALLAGQEPELPSAAAMASAIRFITAEPGEVVGVSGLAEAQRRFGVVRASVTVAPGDRVAELRSSWDRVGEVLTVGLDPARAQAYAEEATAAIRVSVLEGARL